MKSTVLESKSCRYHRSDAKGMSLSVSSLCFHQSRKEATLIVERHGGNMMSLNAEPWRDADGSSGDGSAAPESELTFQTHIMKVVWY